MGILLNYLYKLILKFILQKSKMNLIGLILGPIICLGSVLSYVPQFYNIIKYESVEGISEMCLVLMNIGLMCLTMNSLIFSWKYFSPFQPINLLPFIQIALSWVMVLIYYIIFITFKFRKKKEERLLYGLHYVVTYLLFSIFVIALSLGEKIQGHDSFFTIFATILGYTSAVLNCLVFLPQIYKIYKNKSRGNISVIMYILQTPGNLVIIIFQAVVYQSALSTWITYVVVLVEQLIILIMMAYYHYRPVYQIV